MSVPVVSVEQMREWEQTTWSAGGSEADVIDRVGRAVARRALQLTQTGDRILVLAGKGHNGDDARAAGDHMPDRQVDLVEVTDPKAALARLEKLLAHDPALVVDGLFGIGLRRSLDQSWKKLIQRINAAHRRVLAVDVPSGLDANNGKTQGAAVRAAVTLTVGAPKKGMLQPPAWPYVGRLEVATDIGLTRNPPRSELEWVVPEDFAGFPPRRPVAGHKGDFGHVAIVAGSPGYHGAAVLAAKAAQRAQPGLISLWTPDSVYAPIATQLQAVMVHPWKHGIALPEKASAVLIGPGLAATDLPDDIKILARRLWKNFAGPVIVDASALDWLPAGTVSGKAIRVITPHPGEAARLLKTTPARVQQNRVEAVRKLSRRFGNCHVVLKGHQTLIGRSSGPISVNPSGNPELAQGGAGDVLAGYLAGLLAQPTLAIIALQTIRFAVWQHGATADNLQSTRSNWIVEDLLVGLGEAKPAAVDRASNELTR
jgi:NAD(P)H-hydrate epimerase